MKIKVLGLLCVLLICSEVWGKEGDVFKEKSVEGIEMFFTVLSEAKKTCKVGTDDVNHDYLSENQSSIDRNQEGVLTIPISVNGYIVEAIGAFAFYECKIEEFLLPNTIKTIEKYAFASIDNLKYIDIPETVESIGESAFGWCDNLVQVHFHDGLKTIGEMAFYCCGLTSLVLPNSIEYIDYEAFTGTRLATITVHSSSPFRIKKSCFSENIYNRTTLYVPQGTKVNYSNSEWGSFRKINEGEPLFQRPTDIVYPVDANGENYWPYIICNKESTINVSFENKRRERYTCWQ